MNEWQLVGYVGAGLIGLFGFSFGIFWKIIQDVKKSAHARLDRMENRMTDYVKSSEINGQLRKIDTSLVEMRADSNTKFTSLTDRIDNLILLVNGTRNA